MNYNPAFEFSFVCGRYGHADLGHKLLIDKGIMLSRKTYVAIGSAQEKGTLRNPFCIETRKRVLREMYADLSEDRLVIGGIDDMSNELNRSTSWGTYLKNHLMKEFGRFPDLILYGREGSRSAWFEESDMTMTSELLVPRSLIPISGTEIRGMLLINDEESWCKNVPEDIYYLYPDLREELMEAPIYREIFNVICKIGTLDMDTFMKVYEKYAEADRRKKALQLKQMQK